MVVKRVYPKLSVERNTGVMLETSAKYRFEGEFSVVSHVLLDDLARGVLRAESVRVLAAVLQLSKRGTNRFEGTQVWLGEHLGMHREQVARAFRQLKDAGYLIRVDESDGGRFWYVDARRAFHGGAKRHDPALQKQKRQRERDRRANVVALPVASSAGVAA